MLSVADNQSLSHDQNGIAYLEQAVDLFRRDLATFDDAFRPRRVKYRRPASGQVPVHPRLLILHATLCLPPQVAWSGRIEDRFDGCLKL